MDVDLEILEIERALLDDMIGWEEARAEIVRIPERKKLKKPWQRKQWQRERDALIGDRCTQCGSEKKPLVLQHLWHPRGFDEILRDLAGLNVWKDFKREYDLKIGGDLLEDRNFCPSCDSLSIYKRKTMSPAWYCTKCNTSFDAPKVAKGFTKKGREKLGLRKFGGDEYKSFSTKRKREFRQLYGKQYGKEAVLISIEENRRYLSFADTTTFCGHCAFLWDKKGMRLCRRCHSNWHSLLYSQCRKCEFGT